MKLLNFTIIKLTICLIIGILISYYFSVSLNTSFLLISITFFLTFIAYLVAKKVSYFSFAFGILALLSMVCVGVFTEQVNKQVNHPKHYTKHFSNANSTITFRVRTVLKPGQFYNKYIIDVLKIDSKTVTGKSLLNVKKDSIPNLLEVDDIALIKTGLKSLIHPLNPNQFDYKTYLEKQYVYHQGFATNNQIFHISNNKHSILGLAHFIRNHINKKLKQYQFKKDELAIINALLLGQRQDISKAIYTNYTNAGAIHILAVSGLHVGIIMLILSFIFKPIERIKYGNYIKITCIVILLWCFAIIAGLSPSVTRAVTMFSLVAIGINLNRKTNIYNTLAISMFLLLLIKPMFIFDIGFQLSYVAVFAIVWIQPLIEQLWKPKGLVFKKLWQVFTVTLAAQFGVIPLSLFYFHKLPGLFFVSNLLIIPILGFVLGFGVLILILAVCNLLPTFLANAFGFIINTINKCVAWIGKQDQFLFEDISFNTSLLSVFYFCIITFIVMLKHFSYKRLQWFLASIIIVQITFMFQSSINNKHRFIVFHKSRFTNISIQQNKQLTVYNNFDSITQVKDKTITNYTVENFINSVKKDTLKNVFKFNNNVILVVDSLGVYNIKSFNPKLVLLKNSPKINLNRLIDSIQPTTIIADGSNYKSYIARWKQTCKKQKVTFHQTSKNGAFILKD